MDLEKLIHIHNKSLEERAKEGVYPRQRLKTRLKEKGRSGSNPFILGFRKWVIIYSFIFLLLVFFNFKLIDWLRTKNSPKAHVITMNENPFQPVFPGSISQVYLEDVKWSESF